jgi:hypothetical protein
MKYLALSLLLVGVAAAVQADESLLNQACSGALGETFVSKSLDAEAIAGRKVTITRSENATDDEWENVLTYVKMMLGEPAAEYKGQSIVFEFVREDKAVDEWLKLLSNLELITTAIRTSVENVAHVTVE